MKERTTPISGAIYEIKLNDGGVSYARFLSGAVYAFYDYHSKEHLQPDEIRRLSVLFKICVMEKAVTSKRWKHIAIAPLEPELQKLVSFFKQDAIEKQTYSIYVGGAERNASREECIGLERLAVWDPEHVESRLLDHYEGRMNKWVESLRP